MYTYKVPRPNVTVWAFGPKDAQRHGLLDWSLRSLQNQGDVQKHHRFATELCIQLSKMGVQRGYAPHVVPASAQIVDATELKDRIRLGRVDLFRQRDLPADGIFLKPSQAFVMSAAGCPIITATDSGCKHMVVAHAGRDSLIDRGAVTGVPTRKHISVVHAIIDAFRERGIPAHQIDMCMQFSIPTVAFEHEFSHPHHGRYNRALGEFVDERWPGCTVRKNGSLFLNLQHVFLEQAARAHVRSLQAIEPLDEHPDLAHTRDGKDPGRRNLFIVKRNN